MPAETLKTSNIKYHRDNLSFESLNYKQMLKHPHVSGFQLAFQIEIKQLTSKGVWKEASLDECTKAGKKSIPTTWVFRYKFDDQNYLLKHKVKLCVRGDFQQTEQNTFVVTLALRIFRVLMTIVAAFDLEIKQYDAINTFVNSDIDEPTYCISFDEWTDASNKLLSLLKALYGLKQSSALWYKHLLKTLIELDLNRVSEIKCLFINDYMLLFFYVNDIAVLYHRNHIKQVDEFQTELFQAYEMRYFEKIQWFLNIRIVSWSPQIESTSGRCLSLRAQGNSNHHSSSKVAEANRSGCKGNIAIKQHSKKISR